MEYNVFKNLIMEQLHSHFGTSKEITIKSFQKNNGVEYEGIVILDKQMNISPTIYLDYYFREYQNGQSFDDVFLELLDDYEDHCPDTSVDVSFFTQFDHIKPKIVFKLIHQEKNQRLLEDIPHIPYLDLAIVFYALYESMDLGTGRILIHNEHLERWGTTALELLEIAKINTPVLLPFEFKNIMDVLMDQSNSFFDFDQLGDIPLYVLTNRLRLFGASCMLYPKLLAYIGQTLDSDYYILPSSLHELIIIPAKDMSELRELSQMVDHINENDVITEEVLSDHAYYYERETEEVLF